MGRKIITAAVGIALVLGCVVACNADCRQFFRQQVVYQQQAYIAQPVVLYQAGRDVELDALAERLVQRLEQRLTQKQSVSRQPIQKNSAVQAPSQSPDAQSMESPSAPTLAMAQQCAKCHSGATPKAGMIFDGETALLCSQITKALRAIASDKMPKDHALTPDQKGAVMEELLALEHREEVAAPAPAPDQP